MEVIRASHVGLCFGVDRATRLAEAALGAGAVTLGPLMHNPQEVARLAELGIGVIERVDEHAGRQVVIRTHGVSLQEIERARQLGVDLVDATCPHVLAPRRKMQAFGQEGRTVLLVGDRDHPEVLAQVSHASGPIHVVGDLGELPDLPPELPVGVVAQTTLATDGYEHLAEEIRQRFRDVAVVDTICQDAHQRQQAGRELASMVDLVVVVGGRNSANTTHLAKICSEIQPNTLHVETAREVQGIDMGGIVRIGLTSGASTPEWVLARVEHALMHP